MPALLDTRTRTTTPVGIMGVNQVVIDLKARQVMDGKEDYLTMTNDPEC